MFHDRGTALNINCLNECICVETRTQLHASCKELADELWKSDPRLLPILTNGKNLAEVRRMLFAYLNSCQRALYNLYSKRKQRKFHYMEKNNAMHCARVIKNIIRTENEKAAGASALSALRRLSEGNDENISSGFVCEMIALFRGLNGKSGLYRYAPPAFLSLEGRDAAIERSRFLDRYAREMEEKFRHYPTGIDPEIVRMRSLGRKRIMARLKAKKSDWEDYKWHLRNAVSDVKTLESLVKLSKKEQEGLLLAEKHGIPFQITPYYLSLFLPSKDRAGASVRAQVLPSAEYCRRVFESRQKGDTLDFMGEDSTSPINCITRRYPQILILKPYDSCPQICVYCQRNWEIKRMCETQASMRDVNRAISWIEKNPHIKEVLVTGGDPLTLPDSVLEKILDRLSKIRHITRIRMGTRTLVTVPFRINGDFIAMLRKYHELGRREICIVTHVEHPIELTPDVLLACRRIKEAGMSIYNQQVFTYYNSRKFETCKLRQTLKLFGIDPYYSFNTKGKEETSDFRVPIARIEQERKEEARLLPGLERTDEPVFNVPRLGKSHLRAWQDHEVIMVLPDGRRVYRFYPWESKLELMNPYDYSDVSIYDYLRRLDADGEDVNEYRSIWYYF